MYLLNLSFFKFRDDSIKIVNGLIHCPECFWGRKKRFLCCHWLPFRGRRHPL